MKDDIRKIFNNVDPIGIFFEDNINEYDSEIEEYLKIISDKSNKKATYIILKEIFTAMFDKQIFENRKYQIKDLSIDLDKYLLGNRNVLEYKYKNKHLSNKIANLFFSIPNFLVVTGFIVIVFLIIFLFR